MKIMLDFADFEHHSGFCFADFEHDAMMLDFDEFEDDAGL